ncbi:hypothetical protein JXJ21_06445 [candidate division KSB1 bacterium]|nr:hypothetical protein [candidate division KSB1 bacterium]
MKKTTLTPEESLLLITKTIEETKQRFKENGHIIILWGVLTFVVFSSQYILVELGFYKKFDIIWTTILFPLGAIYSFIYYWIKVKKENLPRNIIGRIIRTMAWVFGVNFMILGFFFSQKLGEVIAPIFIILLALFIIIIGISIKFKPLTIGGILLNLMGFATFYINGQYHALIMATGAVIAMIIPGILLNRVNRKENV